MTRPVRGWHRLLRRGPVRRAGRGPGAAGNRRPIGADTARACGATPGGEAYARKADAAGVRRELAAIVLPSADIKALGSYGPQMGGMVEVAKLVLSGRAAMIEGKPTDAAKAFSAAAQIQDRVLGRLSDPPGWWYPVRRSYAAALLEQGKADEAAAQARQTLKTWPADPVTLAVLAQAERKLGDGKAADLHLAQARHAWHGATALAAAAAVPAV